MQLLTKLNCVFAILFGSTQFAMADSMSMEASVAHFLKSWTGGEGAQYVAAFRDLNDDGKPEAIVYLGGSAWCGSGGCTTLILAQEDDSWRIVTKVSITRRPIRVLQEVSNGWRSLGVWVQGGGIQPGYEADLSFDGKTYPRNPTVKPAKRSPRQMIGETIIAE